MAMGPTFSKRATSWVPDPPEVSPEAGPLEVSGLLASLPPTLRAFGEAYHAMIASCHTSGDDSTASPQRAAEVGHAALLVLGEHPRSAIDFTRENLGLKTLSTSPPTPAGIPQPPTPAGIPSSTRITGMCVDVCVHAIRVPVGGSRSEADIMVTLTDAAGGQVAVPFYAVPVGGFGCSRVQLP